MLRHLRRTSETQQGPRYTKGPIEKESSTRGGTTQAINFAGIESTSVQLDSQKFLRVWSTSRPTPQLYMTEWFLDIFSGSLFGIPLERFGDEFLGIETDCEHQCKHDSTKKNAEGKLHNARSNL